MPEGKLIVCATPIGNLGDVSDRLRETLASADVVYAEDTRRTAILLAHVGADVTVRSLFTGNERARTTELVEAVRAGKTVALVSDAGMPTISDPGAEAVRRVREIGRPVSVVPGPSAVTAAVALSGFGGSRFAFEGFLPRKGAGRAERLQRIAAEDRIVVLFASPRRLAADLTDLAETLGPQRRVAVARELTKVYEEVWVGTLAEALERWAGETKGEVTLVIEPAEVEASDVDAAVESARALVAEGLSVSDAARQVAATTGVSRRLVYQALLEGQERS
ncbi:MAG: 16S rRNA (cytidine(1402)-2'-O)-methyltransferase [Acidimicrobiia bacterium]